MKTQGKHNIIHENVEIGEGTILKSFIELRPGTKIGKCCYIDSYVKSSGNNLIGDNVTLRYNSTIARGVRIGEGCYISPNVMFVNLQPENLGKKTANTVLEDKVFIGANSVINDGVHIPEGTIIGALSFVRKTIEEPGTYGGNPLRRIR